MDKQLHEAISAVAREEMELGPLFLALFSGELEAAKQASYDLWVCLCNQGQITPAALPSYGILREGLLTLPQELKVEVLDILYQFAVGSSVPGEPWRRSLRERFLADRAIYQGFAADPNEDISAFAQLILEQL